MLNLNRVTLLGNLIEDPTVRNTKGDSKVTNFRVATSRKWKDRNSGEQKESRQFHRCVVFGGAAEFVGSLHKGDSVLVEGELTYGKYDNKEGQTIYTTDVQVGFDGRVIAVGNKPVNKTNGETSESTYDEEPPF